MEVCLCDNCRKQLKWKPEERGYSLKITLYKPWCCECYRSKHEETNLGFCSKKCLVEWLSKERNE